MSDKQIDMSANENPFGPSPKAIEAITAMLPALASYPNRDDAIVCESLANLHDSRLGPEHFTTTNSGVDMLSLIERALFEDHNSVVVCPPAFYMYQKTTVQNRGSVIEVPLDSESFNVDVDNVIAAVRDDTRLVFLCNPDNPTGRCFGDDVLDGLLTQLPASVTLVYDEVYYHFMESDRRPDVIGHILAGRNLVALHSFSKAYGLAGMRLGYVMARPDLIERIRAIKLPYQVGALGLTAMTAALADTDHVTRTVNNNTEQRALMLDALVNVGYRCWPSQANFILIECPERLEPDAMVKRLLERGIKVRPAFGLDRHIRVTVSLPEHNAQFIHSLADILAGEARQQ